ncbi:hypothetical protein MMC30_006954 [Trapelia coarctata]|nr:hypothetical protein [Trapelia coarctata]
MKTYDESEDGEAFGLPDLWRTSKFTSEAETPLTHGLEEFSCHEYGQRGFGSTRSLELHFPDLDTFHYGPLDTTSASESSAVSLQGDEPETIEIPQDDIWVEAGSDNGPPKERWLKTWEAFYDPGFKEPILYISEAGPRAFDAALLSIPNLLDFDNNRPSSGHALLTDSMLRGLFQLGMGGQSSLFIYDLERQSFAPRAGSSRVSGYSMDITESLVATFITYGNHMVHLRSFVDKAYKQSSPCATLIAAAATVSSISTALLSYIWRCLENNQSLLQLQAVFDRPGQLMSCIGEMTRKISNANSDETILCSVFDSIQALEQADSWLRPIALQILSSISKPWLASLSRSIGLQVYDPAAYTEPSTCYGTVWGVGGDTVDTTQGMPKFFRDKELEMIIESRQSLELLRSQSPDHVMLCPPHGKAPEVPELEWHFDWADIERIEAKAKRYEASIQQTLVLKHNSRDHTRNWVQNELQDSHSDFDPFGASTDKIQADISDSRATFEQPSPMAQHSVTGDIFPALLNKAFSRQVADPESNVVFAPALAVTSLLSFSPILAAQSRLLNLSCLRMLFKEHDLRGHLRLQRRFHLFGDGMFTSRLSHALFDTELESAERRKGHVRTGKMGLKLGSRNSWPPASSELRLVLMAILTETYYSTVKTDVLVPSSGELPGGLSFALRDLSEDEIQKCMELHSIEALDFLRLQYKAPSPIDAIITTSSLEKYDVIFRLLLRVTRMLFVVNQLSRIGKHRFRTSLRTDPIASRFRFEAHHFVSTIAEYFSAIAVGSNWDQFQAEVEQMGRRLDNDDFPKQLGNHEGLCQLQMRHEQMLDSMMFALLSRKRQQQAVKLLEDVFGLILAYNKSIIDGTRKGSTTSSSIFNVDHIYREFRAKIRAFIDECRSLVEQDVKGPVSKMHLSSSPDLLGRHGSRQSSPSALTQLLLRLEINDHYSEAFRR